MTSVSSEAAPIQEADYMNQATEEILKQGGEGMNSTLRVIDAYMQARTHAISLIMGLKDSMNKKNELLKAVEGMGHIFSELSVLCGANAGNSTKELNKKLDDLISTTSYADKAKNAAKNSVKVQVTAKKTVLAAPVKSVIITPIDKEGVLKTSDDTKKRLLKELRPIDLGIKPERITRHGTQGVRITTASADMNKINAEALKKAGLEVKIMGKLNPRLAVFGVPSAYTEDTLRDDLTDALLNVNDGDIIVKHKFGPRDKHYNHWVIEVIPEIRNKLIEQERVYLGWSSCIVRDHIRILRCYKCQKFGHLQKDCRSDTACGHCGENHETKDCKNQNNLPTCINCQAAKMRDFQHEARSTKCQMLAKRTQDLISNIDYGKQ